MGQKISKNANGGYAALEKSKSGALSQTFLNLSIYHSQEILIHFDHRYNRSSEYLHYRECGHNWWLQ